MAFQEVKVDPKELQGSYVKFNAVGDKLAGIYVSKSVSSGKYGEQNNYKFRTREGEKTVTAPTHLQAQLAKAEAAGLLVPGAKVMISYIGDHDVGQASPMKIFKLMIDPEAAKSAPPPKPPPADDPFGDDVPF